jgi:hypothetical protein
MSVGGYPAVSIIDWHRSTINRKKRKWMRILALI